MLELKKISKIYDTAGFSQKALDGVSIKFRENEFVSILGQSGSGKTTLLNIVGGLDRYDEGDLIINGKSTKEYKDSDWDTYRNHSIGFVFQTYNLIPHQTALSNVELALTLSGISKDERRKRAIQVLKDVGLEDHINKRPNQMSGGQMQRIAIARALINNPDILLADEPTGALDSETSLQIMDLLKEIAKDRLVIMVTHNPDLAEKYSTRIVKLFDGHVTDDSDPFDGKEKKKEKTKAEKKGSKTHMSFFTALSLSLNNLMTKKTRTFLTSFAGSIGIIGIALILSLSNGVQSYINRVEEDTLSSYPITIEQSSVDMTSLMGIMSSMHSNTEEYETDKIYSNDIILDLMSSLTAKVQTNDLQAFKEFIENGESDINQYINAIQYSYNLDLQLYKADTSNGIVQVNPSTVMDSLSINNPIMANNTAMNYNVFTELFDKQELLESQYDVLAGNWPTKYNEVVLMIDENNQITDYTLYALGIKEQSELAELLKKTFNGEEVTTEPTTYSYDELLNLSFKLVLNTEYYEKTNGMWIDQSGNEDYMKALLEDALEIKIVGIVKPNPEAVISSNYEQIGYTKDLTKYVINKINDSEIAKEQLANENINVFTGKEFLDNNSNDTFDINSLSSEEQAYLGTLSQAELAEIITAYTENAGATYEDNIKALGIVALDNPYTINIYPKDFASKEEISDIIEQYNKDKTDNGEEEYVIDYTDMVGLMMSSVTTIVNVISYVLIAFVAISLVVSSIMIGIITYISVLERTKEIGILRSIGASKKDISRVFNAETLIVGFVAGAIGIGATIILNIPINIIIKNLVDISNIASLPVVGAVVLVAISMFLTFIAGLIPSRLASKKDPVEALRTE